MRVTEKFRKGHTLAKEKGFELPFIRDNEVLYTLLENKGFRWLGKSREWLPDAETPSTTIFADKQGKPTGIMRLRLMCHPDETAWLIRALEKNPDFSVIEVSEKTYANRHGAGERAYLTIKRK